MEAPTSALVFCRTRSEVDELQESLAARGYRVDAIHGGLTQEQRDRVMKRFREGSADLLIATDVAARGLDIARLSHVVNYDVPASPEMYVHRTGRTGRAGRAGVAITLAQPREERMLRQIEKLTRQKIEIATLPTVADLNARRLDITRAALREAIASGGLDRLPHGGQGAGRGVRDPRRGGGGGEARPRARRHGGGGGSRPATRFRPRARRRAPGSGWRASSSGRGGRPGVRPKDLVGAITKGAGVAAAALGAIQIGDRSSVVEVRASEVKALIDGLRKTPLRGKKVPVRLYEER